MEGNTSFNTLESALKKYEDYVTTSHPLDVFRRFRDKAEEVASRRDYLSFAEQPVDECFIIAVLHEGIEMGSVVAAVSTPDYEISLQLEAPLKNQITQISVIIRPDNMLEVVPEGENHFDILPFYQQGKFIEEILANLLEVIADDNR